MPEEASSAHSVSSAQPRNVCNRLFWRNFTFVVRFTVCFQCARTVPWCWLGSYAASTHGSNPVRAFILFGIFIVTIIVIIISFRSLLAFEIRGLVRSNGWHSWGWGAAPTSNDSIGRA